jgi:hypothetical protein
MEEMMAKTTPKVRDHHLFCYPDPAPFCALDSAEWFVWLETAVSFRYFSGQRHDVYNGNGPLFAPVSLRKERRRRGWLWYGYRRVYGVLHKRYVGRSVDLTRELLEKTALVLNEIW